MASSSRTADNRFQLYGTVVIGNQVYRGLLLEGTPTAFGAQAQNGSSLTSADVFDLNMKITGGKLAGNLRARGLLPDHSPVQQHLPGEFRIELLRREAPDEACGLCRAACPPQFLNRAPW